MASLRMQARAKINLDLRVLGTRPDGYHELRTIFQTLDLHDTVTVTRVRGACVSAAAPVDMPLDRTNLAWRAAEALWQALAARASRTVSRSTSSSGFRRRLVLAAAAAMRRRCSRRSARYGSSDASCRLHGVAASLGADVPFFLVGGTALGLGRGDESIRSRTCRSRRWSWSGPTRACPPRTPTPGSAAPQKIEGAWPRLLGGAEGTPTCRGCSGVILAGWKTTWRRRLRRSDR